MENETKNIVPQDKETGSINKKIRRQFEKLVREYIDSEHKEDRFIYKLAQIQEYLNTRTDIPEITQIPNSTFYRYIDNMGIKQFPHPLNNDKKHYNFDNDTENSLDFGLDFPKYNKTLYVTVSQDLGDFLSTLLNRNFSKKLFYSIHTQGLLVCHYYDEKNADKSNLGKNYLTSKYLKKEIVKITESIKYSEN